MTPQIRFCSIAAVFGAIALNGCGPVDGAGHPAGGRQNDGWTKAPRIESVRLNGNQALISGLASSGARVVLRGDGGETFAAAADAEGRFDLTIALTDGSVILMPEVQQGQDAIRGPQKLVILTEASLAVLQSDGGGSERLTPGPNLDAVDSDGQALVASGRGKPGQTVQISVPGSFEAAIKVGDDRRWSTVLSGAPARGFILSVDGRTYDYPGLGSALKDEENQRLEASSNGWRLTRKLGDRAYLTSWFPNP